MGLEQESSDAPMSDIELSQMFNKAASEATPAPVTPEEPKATESADTTSNTVPGDGANREQTTPAKPEEAAGNQATPPAQPDQQSQKTQERTQQLLEAAQNLGVPVDGIKSGEDLALAALRKVQQDAPLLEYANKILPYIDQIQEFFDQKKNADAGDQKQEETKEWTPDSYFQEKWGGPVWEDRFTQAINSGYVERDPDTGLYQATEGYESMVGSMIEPLNAANQHAVDVWQGLSRGNPYQKFYENMLEPMRRQWQADMQETFGQRDTQTKVRSEIEKFTDENESWLFTKDIVSGQSVQTPEGKEFLDTIAQLHAEGITDTTKLLNYALKMTGRANQRSAPTQQQTSQLQSALGDGQIPQPAQNKQGNTNQQAQQSFLEGAMKRASHSPTSNGQNAAVSGVPELMTEGDLNNMFVQAYKGSRN